MYPLYVSPSPSATTIPL